MSTKTSAPVGVKTLSEFMAEQEAIHPGIHDKVQAATDELRASLAQQHASEAERAFFAQDFYEEAREGKKPWPAQQAAADCTCPHQDAREPHHDAACPARLAQQPAETSITRREQELIASAATHCDNCGCSWLDNGLNPVGCPYCKRQAWARELLTLAEQWERDAAGCRRDGYIDAAVVKEDCAQRIRQTLGISTIGEVLAARDGVQAWKVELSYNDLCRLSSVFNDHSELHLEQDRRINEWISKRIAGSLTGEQ